MDDAQLQARALAMTDALRAGQRLWANDVLHLYEHLRARIREAVNMDQRATALAWAQTAFQLVEAEPECWRQSLWLRLWMISTYGHSNSSTVLDAERLIDDALQHIPWDHEEARRLLMNWRIQEPDTIRQLSRVRNVLTTLAELSEHLPQPLRERITPWTALRAFARMN